MNRLLRINDPQLVVFALIATGLGLLLIFDAGYAKSMAAGGGPIPKEFKSQVVFLFVAIAAAIAVARLSPATWEKGAKWIWLLSIGALILPLIPGVGTAHNGATRWFKLGPAEIQPAEFAKIAIILFLASAFCSRGIWPKKIKAPRHFADAMDRIWIPKFKRFLPAIWACVAILLIEKEPDMGTAFIVAVVTFVMMILGGVSGKSLGIASAIAVVGLIVLTFSQGYRIKRISHFWDPWTVEMMDDIGYQTVQSKIAVASGGPFGVGVGAGRAKQVEPEATSDFILATLGEEFGLVGVLVLLGVMTLLVRRLFQLAAKAPTQFGSLILGGVGAWIGIQTVLNALMANATLPAVGVPFPFISAGGSSLVALWLGIGLCQAALSPAPEPVTEEESKKSAARRNRWWHRRPRLSRA